MDIILFFDEVNIIEVISCIKEVFCDRIVGGEFLVKDFGLYIIVVCNFYRKYI